MPEDDIVYRRPEDAERSDPKTDRMNNTRGDGFSPPPGGENPVRSPYTGRFVGHSQEEQPMSHPQPVVAMTGGYPITPFGAGFGWPYAGFPTAPVATPASNVVVTGSGDHGHGTHSQLETLSDIALGGLRESAAAGRTNQISNQIESIGDRLDNQAHFGRELSVMREFTAAQKDRGDLENRLLTAIKDESIRTRELFTESRIRNLEERNADLREARRDDRMLDVLQDIRRAVTKP